MKKESRRRQLRLWGAIGAVLLVVVVAAVVLSRGGGSTASAGETGAVTATGEPLPTVPSSGSDGAIGMQAPTISGTSFDGSPVTIDPGASGMPTAIWFVAHWCPHCNAEVPRIVSLNDAGQLPAGIDYYAVSTSVDSSAPNDPPSTWFRSVGWPFPVLADDATGSAAQAYGLRSFPYLVLTDASGNVVYRHSGELGADGIAPVLQQLIGSGTRS